MLRRIRILSVESIGPDRYRLHGAAFTAEVRTRRVGTAWEADCLRISDPAISVEKIETWCEKHCHLLKAAHRQTMFSCAGHTR